ncbi:MAG: hypothetical protein MK111_21975 [Crocosphaera sp.]|uniref:hypothetical protein n=1 Tax=Crocosphaera sp. TaxID=2729996 RepID=UPI002585F1B1|nr:hypothetical protein [Crocosphaera sp.]MCH2247262.1 hypothetical protein [Crocosphaera sp.]
MSSYSQTFPNLKLKVEQIKFVKIDYDSQGRPWALLGRSSQGQSWDFGWVFRELNSCFNS